MKKANSAIDIVKFTGSLLIFALHCNIFEDYPHVPLVLQILARWGVPFFFICSAYYLFRGSENGTIRKEALVAYVKRIGLLYLVWFVYNLPNIIYKRLYGNDLSEIRTWLIFLKESALSSTFTGSWYLASSIFSAWFIYALSKKYRSGTLVWITLPLYLLCAVSSVYHGILPEKAADFLSIFCFPLNIFTGCFYFALGKLIAENRARVPVLFSRRVCCIGFLGFYSLYVMEILTAIRLGIFGGTDIAFSTVGIAFFLFLFCLQSDIEITRGILLRKLSTIIYCCQGNVLLVNGFMKKILDISSVASCCISLCILSVICMVVLYIQKKTRWRWVRYMT